MMRAACLPVLLLLCGLIDAAELEDVLADAQGDHWRTRWAAVEALARLPGDRVFEIRPLLLRDPRARVREAVAWACLLDPGLGNATLLGIAVRKDSQPAVRRAAARALVHFRDRRAVSALVEALGNETDRRTRLQIVETLRALTPAPCLLETGAWRDWWSRNEADPRFQPADEPVRTGSYEGVVLETRTVAPVRPPGGKPRPLPHLLVLPGFGWSTASYGAFLLPLRRRAAMTWVRLPSVQSLTGSSGYGDDVPVYPVDRLVVALDRFRQSLRLERFVVVASGASGWIAMRFAQRFEKHCAGLVLIDTALDRTAYAACLQRAAARGDLGEKFTARTLMHQNAAPFDEATLRKLHTLALERGYHDPAELEIGYLFHTAREPQGFATVPEIEWRQHRELAVPALFIYSGSSAFSGHGEAGRIQRHFPNSLVAPIHGARGMPYVEENEAFHRVLDRFLGGLE